MLAIRVTVDPGGQDPFQIELFLPGAHELDQVSFLVLRGESTAAEWPLVEARVGKGNIGHRVPCGGVVVIHIAISINPCS